MSEPHTNRPADGNDALTLRGLYAYFTLWLTNAERFDAERDRRYEDRSRAQDEKTALALSAAEKAISKAEAATEKRFDAVNEFRGTLSDQAATLLPRAEANARFGNYDEKIAGLQKEIALIRELRGIEGGERAGRATLSTPIQGLIFSVAGAVVTYIVLNGLK